MQDSDTPTKFPIPWANSAGSSYIRPIPVASQIGIQNGAASLTDGFPPLNSLPIASGGTPPFMQDHNGILNQATAGVRWLQAGGPVYYDGTFSSAIGGYPKGTQLMSSVTNGLVWINQVDNNTTNPDSGGSNWTSIYAQTHTWSATQTFSANVQVNASATITGNLTVNGEVITPVIQSNAVALSLVGGTSGTNLNNHANTAVNVGIDDATGNVTTRGNVSAGHLLRAGTGATGSGDSQAATILNDFGSSMAGNGYQKLPSGLIIQWASGVAPVVANTDQSTLFNFPVAFPNGPLQFVIGFGGNTPQAGGYIIAAQASPSTAKTQILVTTNGPANTNVGFSYIAIGL